MTLAIAWLCWLLLANAWLNLGAFGWPVIRMDAAEVRVGHAFSFWPGKVSGRGLRILARDADVELELDIDAFELDIATLAVVHHQLRTRSARLDGVVLHLRLTRTLKELCAHAPGLPAIPGQALPLQGAACLAQAETAKPHLPDDPVEKVFHMQLDGLDVRHLREVWIEDQRLSGELAFRGRWILWPRKELAIGLTEFRLKDGTLVQDQKQRAERMELSLSGELAPFALGQKDDVWSKISATLKLRFEQLELAGIRSAVLHAKPLAPPSFPALEGLANLQLDAALERGHVRSFELDVQGEQVGIALPERRLASALRLRVNLHESAPGRLLFARTQLQLRKPRLDEQRFDDVEATLDAVGESHLDPERQEVHLDFEAAVSKVKFVLALIPGGLPRTVAKLLIGEDDQARALGTLHARASGAEVRDFRAGAGGLSLEGGFAFAPKLFGELTAKFGPVSVKVPLRPDGPTSE